jgi:hypothetical protein
LDCFQVAQTDRLAFCKTPPASRIFVTVGHSRNWHGLRISELAMLNPYAINDEVAVLPQGTDSPRSAMCLRRITSVGHVFVQTDDKALYMISDGSGLRGKRRIVPATDEHRDAVWAHRSIRTNIRHMHVRLPNLRHGGLIMKCVLALLAISRRI